MLGSLQESCLAKHQPVYDKIELLIWH